MAGKGGCQKVRLGTGDRYGPGFLESLYMAAA